MYINNMTYYDHTTYIYIYVDTWNTIGPSADGKPPFYGS